MLAWVGNRLRVVRFAVGAAASGASVLLVACGLQVGGLLDTGGDDGGGADAFAPDATLDAPGGEIGSIDAGGGSDATDADAADSSSPSGDSGTAVDSGSGRDGSTVDGCVHAGPENCTDGTDNDCNGFTDCEDPACTSQGYACVPPAPAGWAFVAFAPVSTGACPSSLQTTAVDVDPVDTNATCTCTCDVGTPPTCTGMVTTKFGTNGTCPSVGISTPADGACNTFISSVPGYVQVSNPAGSGGSCVANPTIGVPPAGSTPGEICSGEKAFGAGCSGGNVCALVPAPFGSCVAKNGQVGCPAQSYTAVHYAGHLSDTRTCSNCQCSGGPMCGLTWNFYNTMRCSGTPGLTLTPDGTCQASGSTSPSYASNVLTGDPSSATCAPPTKQPMPTGQVTLNAEQTVCCE
jgi:hypothetical protein